MRRYAFTSFLIQTARQRYPTRKVPHSSPLQTITHASFDTKLPNISGKRELHSNPKNYISAKKFYYISSEEAKYSTYETNNLIYCCFIVMKFFNGDMITGHLENPEDLQQIDDLMKKQSNNKCEIIIVPGHEFYISAKNSPLSKKACDNVNASIKVISDLLREKKIPCSINIINKHIYYYKTVKIDSNGISVINDGPWDIFFKGNNNRVQYLHLFNTPPKM